MGAVTKETFQNDLKSALKGRDNLRVSTLRLLLAAIKNKEIELGKPLEEAELIAVINSGIKKGREALEGCEKAGREDLAEKERAEMAILQGYLPQALGESELAALIEEAVRETRASSAKEMGAVMKYLMPRIAGRADGRIVNQMVRAKLT